MLEQLKDQLLPANHPYTKLCQRVVSRLVYANGLEQQRWVVHVIRDDDQANAFCMPGGQIFVFTGILKYTRDEDGLAAVLGHEISHKVARHHAEQMSGRLWAFVFILAAAVLGDVSSNLSNTIYNLVFDLRNSRTQEAEADQMGLLMMAKSCYDPHAAEVYWRTMVQMEHDKHQSTPQLLSTHPASENRVKAIEHWIPEAMRMAEENDCRFTRDSLSNFSDSLRGQFRRF
ncbi:putative mitochondrial inner membrane metallopeptidase [Phaeomoniella chlamydospora]|uniref:Putative mitochondrial inner membrane metallopeptidase n=1 Tax=Phaeomoniella chlamydospora TaxID=158046 RepID=A0A0G2GVV4_PHACM|nr:putative mitochondrial inner membrane metallopeptidase [Phaeomoniella chlamydospora]